MIVYAGYLWNTHQKKLRKSRVQQDQGIQDKRKSIILLYNDNKHVDAKIKNTLLLTMAQNTNKIFRYNSKKTCIRPTFSKLHKTDERSQTPEKNWRHIYLPCTERLK